MINSKERKDTPSLLINSNKFLYKDYPKLISSFDYKSVEDKKLLESYSLKYRDYSHIGLYEFDYSGVDEDILQSLRYPFTYNNAPVYGNYQFYYTMDKDIYIQEEVLINKISKDIYENNNLLDRVNVQSASNINKIDSMIDTMEYVGIESIVLSNYYKLIKDRAKNTDVFGDKIINSKTSQIKQYSKDFILSSIGKKILKYDEGKLLGDVVSSKIELIENVAIEKFGSNYINKINEKLLYKERLSSSLNNAVVDRYMPIFRDSVRGVKLSSDTELKKYTHNIHKNDSIQMYDLGRTITTNKSKLVNRCVSNIITDKDIKLHGLDKNIIVESDIKINGLSRKLKTNFRKEYKINKYLPDNIIIDDGVKASSKSDKVSNSYSSEYFSNKLPKISNYYSNEHFSTKVEKNSNYYNLFDNLSKSDNDDVLVMGDLKLKQSDFSEVIVEDLIGLEKVSSTIYIQTNEFKSNKLSKISNSYSSEIFSNKLSKISNYYNTKKNMKKNLFIGSSYSSEKFSSKSFQITNKFNSEMFSAGSEANVDVILNNILGKDYYKDANIYSNEFKINKFDKISDNYDNEAYSSKIVKVSNSYDNEHTDIYIGAKDINIDSVQRQLYKVLHDIHTTEQKFLKQSYRFMRNYSDYGSEQFMNKVVAIGKLINNEYRNYKVDKLVSYFREKFAKKISHNVSILNNEHMLSSSLIIGKTQRRLQKQDIFQLKTTYKRTGIQLKNNLLDKITKNSSSSIEKEYLVDKSFHVNRLHYFKNDRSNSMSKVSDVFDLSVESSYLLDKVVSTRSLSIQNIVKSKMTPKSAYIDKDLLLNKDMKSKNISIDKYVVIDNLREVVSSIENSQMNTKKVMSQSISIIDTQKDTDLATVRNTLVGYHKELKTKKRLWFIKGYGDIDYKIIPNEDDEYPAQLNMFMADVNDYQFNYQVEIPKDSNLIIELYNKDYRELTQIEFKSIRDINGYHRNARYEMSTKDMINEKYMMLYLDIFVDKLNVDDGVEYVILRHKKSKRGITTTYLVGEEFIGSSHPLPMGSDMGLKEIAIPIPIMVEFINILMLFWTKFYYAFSGYSGTQAIYGLLNLVHDWLSLEESQNEDTIAYYERCFRWFRWESEKVYQRAKQNVEYAGNFWVEEVIFELIDYMETHHLNINRYMNIHLQDEFRDIFKDPSYDFDATVTRVKGIRNRVLSKRDELD